MTYSLYLAHINDTHSHFESSLLHFNVQVQQTRYRIDASCGGYAKIATAITQHRRLAASEQQPFIFLHAGDSFQGSLYFSCFKGRANAKLLNLLQPDAMTIGNHEFDLGNNPISEFIANVNFPVLAGNMDLSEEDQDKEKPLRPHANLLRYDNQRNIAQYLLKPLADKKLAIVGITLDLMHQIGCPDSDCLFHNAIETTRATIKHLHEQGIKHIIVLSHLGYAGDVQLAEQVDGISIIVGGHSHTLTGDFSELDIPSVEQQTVTVNHTLILQAGKHAESIGLEKLTFDSKGQVIAQQGGISFLLGENWHAYQGEDRVNEEQRADITNYLKYSKLFYNVKPDAAINDIINKQYKPAVDEMRQRIVCHLSKPLHHTRLPNNQWPTGSEIAPLVSEGFYVAASKDQEIDFAMHNAGGVRISLKQGPLTQAEICGRLLPFEIKIVSYLVLGEKLRLAIEGAINNATSNGVVGTGDGSYPYLYNLRFSYDKDAILGQRISELMLFKNGVWQCINDETAYRGVSSAYTLAGKEGYDALLTSTEHFEHPVTMSGSFVALAKQRNW